MTSERLTPTVTKADLWQVCFDWQIARVTAYAAARPGHVVIHARPGGTAVLFDQPGYLSRMNRVFGASADPRLLEPLLACYRDWPYPPEVWLGHDSSLCEAGAERLGLETTERFLVVAERTAELPAPKPAPADLDFRRVSLEEKSSETRRFFDIYLEAFRSPAEHLETSLAHLTMTGRIEGVHGFMASCGGEDVAAALLYQRGDLGFLSGGATRPAWQRKGAQSALISARIELARELGLGVVCCHAVEGSRSIRNLVNGGLKPMGTLPIWRPAKV